MCVSGYHTLLSRACLLASHITFNPAAAAHLASLLSLSAAGSRTVLTEGLLCTAKTKTDAGLCVCCGGCMS